MGLTSRKPTENWKQRKVCENIEEQFPRKHWRTIYKKTLKKTLKNIFSTNASLQAMHGFATYNQVKVWHFSRGIFTLVRSCPISWEVVPPRETSGGFDFSRGKNQTKPTSHEEALNHTILTSHEEQNQTIPLLTSIKTIPSLHLTSIKNHTIPTSHE